MGCGFDPMRFLTLMAALVAVMAGPGSLAADSSRDEVGRPRRRIRQVLGDRGSGPVRVDPRRPPAVGPPGGNPRQAGGDRVLQEMEDGVEGHPHLPDAVHRRGEPRPCRVPVLCDQLCHGQARGRGNRGHWRDQGRQACPMEGALRPHGRGSPGRGSDSGG
jgi:hypothetical protein